MNIAKQPNPLETRTERQQRVNHVYNASINCTDVKVVRWHPPLKPTLTTVVGSIEAGGEKTRICFMQDTLLPQDIFSGVSIVRSSPVPAQSVRVMSHSFTATDMVEDEENRVKTILRLKKEQMRHFRKELKHRLEKSAATKKQAFLQVLANAEAESIQQHAGYLKPPRIQNRRAEKHVHESFLRKTLSDDDVRLQDLPEKRSYLLYPEEKYHFHKQHFIQESSECLPEEKLPSKEEELEKELRLCYRAGHLDEMKRRIQGRVYAATKHHYMDLERHEFLKKASYRPLSAPTSSSSTVLEKTDRDDTKRSHKKGRKKPGSPVKIPRTSVLKDSTLKSKKKANKKSNKQTSETSVQEQDILVLTKKRPIKAKAKPESRPSFIPVSKTRRNQSKSES